MTTTSENGERENGGFLNSSSCAVLPGVGSYRVLFARSSRHLDLEMCGMPRGENVQAAHDSGFAGSGGFEFWVLFFCFFWGFSSSGFEIFFGILDFVFVSDFDIRISDFLLRCGPRTRPDRGDPIAAWGARDFFRFQATRCRLAAGKLLWFQMAGARRMGAVVGLDSRPFVCQHFLT